ncbi:MAG: hypothetical protein H6839_16835 [Planctomycetes bacterium]|nr:hypothetical protein [Planctomycetota bacterium]
MRKLTTPALVLLAVIGVAVGLWLATKPAATPDVAVRESSATNSPKPERQPLRPADASHPEANLDGAKDDSLEPPPKSRPTETPTTETPAAGGILVEGSVVDAESGAAIPDVLVRLFLHDRGVPTKDALPQMDIHEATTGSDGGFKIRLPDIEKLPERSIFVVTDDRYEVAQIPATAENTTIRLKKALTTTIEVAITGAACLPARAWLRWLDSGNRPAVGSKFDLATGKAVISLNWSEKLDHQCVACVDWFDQLVESEPLQLVRGETRVVTLTPPAGASVKIRLIGPDALPMSGVGFRAGSVFDQAPLAVTDKAGDVVFSGIPAPSQVAFYIWGRADAVFVARSFTVDFETLGDSIERVIDLTGTGTVDCVMTAGDIPLYSLVVKPMDKPRSKFTVALRGDGRREDARLVYGLKPGFYTVTAGNWDTEQKFVKELEVLAPPSISNWHVKFETRQLIVRAEGPVSPQGMTLTRYSAEGWPDETLAPDEEGKFVIGGLSSQAVRLRIAGNGYASRIVTVNPAEVQETTVQLERSGTVTLTPRDGDAREVSIAGIDPPEGAFIHTTGQGTFALPPGRYRVSGFYEMTAPWEADEFTVVAEESVEALYGPPFTCTLRVRVIDRSELWNYQVSLEHNGRSIPFEIVKTDNGNDVVQELYFATEGKITLKVSGETIEEFQKEFEIDRSKSVSLEVELKRKQ